MRGGKAEMSTTSEQANETVGERLHRNRWWILVVLSMAQLMVVLDATVVNVALPSAQEDLAFSDGDRTWVITAYALAFGSLLLLGGKIGDLFGRKRVFITGLIGFAGASALGGAATSFEVLVAARALQGVFAALLAPAALSLVTTTFTDSGERGRAFGIWGAIAGGGGGIGLLLGGALTEYVSWRWSLYVNILIAIPAVFGAVALLRHEAERARPRFDLPGVLAVSTGLLALVFGLSRAESDGWGAEITVASLGIGVALLVAFAFIERRAKEPLLPARVVFDRIRGASYVGMTVSGAGIFGVFLFLTYYLQETLGYSPVTTGFAFMPMIGAIVLTSVLNTTRLLPRYGPRLLVAVGMGLAALGMVLFAQLGVEATYALDVMPGLIITGLGMGLTFSTTFSNATIGVRDEDAGVASAMANTSQQVGGSLGTALLNTLAASAVTSYVGSSTDPAVIAQGSVEGYVTAFWWAAAIFAVGGVVTSLLYRGGSTEATPEVASAAPDGPTVPIAEPLPSH